MLRVFLAGCAVAGVKLRDRMTIAATCENRRPIIGWLPIGCGFVNSRTSAYTRRLSPSARLQRADERSVLLARKPTLQNSQQFLAVAPQQGSRIEPKTGEDL